MPSPIRAILLLCDAAQVDPLQKVHILGAGWSVTSTPTSNSAVVAMLKIPWDRTNEQLPTTLRLVGADGDAVLVEGEPVQGPQRKIEVGRPPGIAHGVDIDFSFQLTVPSLPLEPGRYTWVLNVADQEFSTSFEVRRLGG